MHAPVKPKRLCQLLLAALERAKEAGKKERAVCKLREQFGLLEQINSDLTYAVAVNLASVYQAAQLYTEALNSFTQIVRSKQFPQVTTCCAFSCIMLMLHMCSWLCCLPADIITCMCAQRLHDRNSVTNCACLYGPTSSRCTSGFCDAQSLTGHCAD